MNTKAIFAAPILLTLVNPAMAHTGDHSTVTVSEFASHLLQSPVHIAVVVAFLIVCFGIKNFFKSKTKL